jgi:LuxR family maltose regulon positive regulatory protein
METTFTAPGPHAEWADRPHLLQRLTGTAARLVLVSAPAGFGKTTLVAQWRAGTLASRSFAWISLDGSDNDVGRLCRHIIEALCRACPQFGADEILRQLRTPGPDITATVLPILVNELATLAGRVVLVLDDYQVITEPRCHELTAFLLAHLPSSVQIVLITRTDPPLPLARLRATGDMTEFRVRDLRFGLAETASLVRTISDIELTGPDLAVLVERTEGWPAGLFLAAHSLRGHPAPTAFVRQFTGHNRHIADFIKEEVLSRQPAEIRQFLARTCILDRFCAPLCDAVAGSHRAAEILDQLERENLFIVPLDEIRQWYRYHHLFAQALQGQLTRSEPGAAAVLHRRASAWHRRSGSADEAISHAIAAGDRAVAGDLIAANWHAYADAGQLSTVRGWLRVLGDARISADPVTAHCAAWAAALSGDGESVRRWLPVIAAARHDGPLPDGLRSLTSSVALLQGMYGFVGLRVMRETAGPVAELEDDPASPWYALARVVLGYSLYLSGEPQAAEKPLREAVFSVASFPLVRLLSLSALSLVATELGRLPQAQELSSQARVLATRGDLEHTPQASFARTATGALYAAQGRPKQARSELEQALLSRHRVPGISPWPTIEALLLLAQVLLDLGDRLGAVALTDEARQMMAPFPDDAKTQVALLNRLRRRLAGPSREVALAEPLTEREISVLRMLQGTLSLREIGQELHLSANTIKTHTQAIYRKLGVSGRRDAIKRGHQAGFL